MSEATPARQRKSKGKGRQVDNSRNRGASERKVRKFLAGDNEPVKSLTKEVQDLNAAELDSDLIESAAPLDPGETVETCFICAEPVKYSAVSPCNHRSCHVCALRMRALYKTNACVHCRTIQPRIIFTIDHAKKYEEYKPEELISADEKLGIDFDNSEVKQSTENLLKYNCPEEGCRVACGGWGDLRRHVQEIHHRTMCSLCTHNKKVFTHEHKLYTHKALIRHEKFGDESGFTGHPECQFCKIRFYSMDELRVHIREKHEKCHICDKLAASDSEPQYFLNYDQLEKHFREAHFLCPASSCLEKKFVVFEDEIELQAHQISDHGSVFGTGRAARTIETNFQFADSGSSSRSHRNRNNGDSSSSGHNNVAQRNMAARGFGASLSSEPSRKPNQKIQKNDEYDDLTDEIGGRSTGRHESSEIEIFRRQRLDERAAQHASRDSPQYLKFLDINENYTKNKISADEVVTGYIDIFDTDTNEIALLIHEFSELFTGHYAKKQIELQHAFSEWRTRSEDFPSLPTVTTSNKSAKAVAQVPGQGQAGVRIVGSAWSKGRTSGGAGGSSNSSSRTMLNIHDMPTLASLAQRRQPVSSSSSSSSISTMSMTRRPPSPKLSSPMVASQSASDIYGNAWLPSNSASSSSSSANQKITFVSAKPASNTSITASSSSSSPSYRSGGTAKINNLKEFPSLPKQVAKKPTLYLTMSSKSKSSTASSVSVGASSPIWGESSSSLSAAAVAASAPKPKELMTVRKKGKKNTVVFHM
ncbi:uncharacterized protein V1516DRAFT_638763 [Lipomyces oligophaga]|uniref:uncharacterized protein n=1 Tax=Lipomyces oligophaga TaxID=45792 RepID=UPI0034CEF7F7